MFSSLAYAMGTTGGDGGSGGFTAFIPLILMFAVFYFLLIRPQQQKAKKLRDLLNNLQKDDMVVTSGGIHGKIVGITESIVTLEVAPNVRIKVSRGQISGISDAYKRGDEKSS